MTPELEIRKNWRTGQYDVPVPVVGSRKKKWITTGERTLERAREVIAESGVDRMVAIANADAVSAGALSIIVSGRKVTCREVVDGWVQENSGSWSPQTGAQYRTYVGAFFDRYNAWSKPLVAVKRDSLHRFVNGGAVKHSTKKMRLASLRSLYKYARIHNYVIEDWAATVVVQVREMNLEQLETRDIFPLAVEDLRAILDDAKVSVFWKAVTSLAYWTGLRFSDCVCLEWASITPDALIVWTRKRGKRVALPLDDPLIGGGALRAILAAIPRTDPTYCFPSERLVYLSDGRNRFPTAFKELLTRLEIDFKSFHSTRHAAISRFAMAGKTLEEIGVLVAHSNPATTAVYIHP